MLTDLIVIDDIFDNPDEIVSKAKNLEYYDVYSHPDFYVQAKNKQTFYPGLRSKQFNVIDLQFNKYCNNVILTKITEKAVGYYRNDIKINYFSSMYFHYTTAVNVIEEKLFHKDPALFAGVVYLNKNPPANAGTIVVRDGKEIVVDNKYNRLVLYRGDLQHTIQNTFGNTIYDGRLTLTIFYGNISYDLRFNEKKFNQSLQQR